jgi:hypothetical protein
MRFFVGLVLPALLCAQWPSYPERKLDLTGPAPKTADGKPDLSGVWDRGVVPVLRADIPARPGGPPPEEVRIRPGRQFADLSAIFPEGLPMQPWAAQLRAQRKASNSKDHPDAHCLPLHPVQLHSHPQPRKIVQTPGLVMIIYEANAGLRQIFTDGRELPKDEPQPWWYGYSVGKWEGDTLVVESIGFRDENWLDEEGTPMTGSGRITERFRRPNFGTLEIEITVNDPKTFTRPFIFKVNQTLMQNDELIEFVCAENNTSTPHLVGR